MPILVATAVISRYYEVGAMDSIASDDEELGYRKRGIFYEGVIDGTIWIALQVISNCRMILNPRNSLYWVRGNKYQWILISRIAINLAFFLSAFCFEIFFEDKTFTTDTLAYYAIIFVLANAFLLLSVFRIQRDVA